VTETGTWFTLINQGATAPNSHPPFGKSYARATFSNFRSSGGSSGGWTLTWTLGWWGKCSTTVCLWPCPRTTYFAWTASLTFILSTVVLYCGRFWGHLMPLRHLYLNFDPKFSESSVSTHPNLGCRALRHLA